MRVLPADVYDTLELSAEMFGGIGSFFQAAANGSPFCYVGHLRFAGVIPEWSGAFDDYFGLNAFQNDDALVRVFGERIVPLPRGEQPRLPFEQWCKELDVVRGE